MERHSGPVERGDPFGMRARGTTPRTEMMAGFATYLTMAYIVAVNPGIMEAAGIDRGAAFVATCLAAAIGSALMGLLANFPIALAPGMGLNAYFAYAVVQGMGVPWQVALGAVFVGGVVFFAISVLRVREWLVNGIPLSLKFGIAAGIGFFLGLIGPRGMGLVVAHPATLVGLGPISATPTLLACAGFLLIAGLSVRDVAGALSLGVLGIVFTFFLVDLLDNTGTLIATTHRAGLMNKDGTVPNLGRALMADSGGAMVGAALGTSTTVSYIESAAGIQAGGRTGLTALTVAALFC
jgi:adenine/guanine/hypoxanthine permease